MSKKETVEKFRKLVLDMHRGIPIYRYYGLVEQTIPDKEVLNYFLKENVFVKSNSKNQNGQDTYFLGVNGITLANSYKIEHLTKSTEKLTRTMTNLTIWILILTGISLLFGLIQLIKLIIIIAI